MIPLGGTSTDVADLDAVGLIKSLRFDPGWWALRVSMRPPLLVDGLEITVRAVAACTR
jgi:hypothetical protein